MARVMVCDDDEVTAARLVAAIRAAGHEAETCSHTMDVVRGATDGQFDLVVIGLDMAGFGRAGAVDAMRELAPHVALIALHRNPSEIIHTATIKGVAAVLPRPVSARAFMSTLFRALGQKQTLESRPPLGEESAPPFISSPLTNP
jgi:DNA-binding NtrC family response regulator